MAALRYHGLVWLQRTHFSVVDLRRDPVDLSDTEGSTFNPLPTWRSATPWKVKSHIIVPLER